MKDLITLALLVAIIEFDFDAIYDGILFFAYFFATLHK
jgi:hypothetical protein